MKYKRTIFKNGLRLITVPMVDNPTVTVLIGAKTGLFNEDLQKAGISHFLEHMCFKGTKTRPDSKTISTELDSMGAGYNAFTTKEVTSYYVKTDTKYFEKAGDIVADIYMNSVFPESEIEKEKNVVCGEIDMYADSPQSKVWDILREHMYRGEQFELDVIGTKETVKSISRDDLLEYRNSQYKSSNTVIVIAGGISEDKMIDWAEKTFADLPDGNFVPEKAVNDRLQNKPELIVFDKDTDQAHISMAWRSFGRNNPDRFIASLISTILNAGISSRLSMKLREELGSGYYIGASNDPAKTFGYYSISTGTLAERVPEILQAIIGEVDKLKSVLIDSAELEKAKEIKRAGRLMALETSDNIAEFFHAQELLEEKIMLPEDFNQIFSKITAEDIMRVAKIIFDHKKLTVAVLGKGVDREAVSKVLNA